MLRALRPRRWGAAIAIAAGALAPVAGAATAACAGEGHRAALVIDTGSEDVRYCVELDDDSVTGIELIELAGAQHDLEYHLGFGGQAVCMLAGVGPTGDDCFEEYPDFWGYWRGDGSGGWEWSATGAGSTSVEDGDVEGWTWGSGDGGKDHPLPPPTEFDAVCEPVAPEEEATPEPTPRPESPGPSSAPEGDPAAGDEGAARHGDRNGDRAAAPVRKDRRWHEGRLVAEAPPLPVAPPVSEASPSAAPSPTNLAAEPSAGAGPPPAGIGAVVATLALIGGGFVVVRRRS
jgi:hypothetical protein